MSTVATKIAIIDLTSFTIASCQLDYRRSLSRDHPLLWDKFQWQLGALHLHFRANQV
jgi:hypothetical protein